MSETGDRVNRLKSVFTVFLFGWISFFAPLFGGMWLHRFMILLFVLLLVLLFRGKNSCKTVFEGQDLFLLLFVLSAVPAVFRVKEPAVAYDHFWFFIIPVPVLYFFAKAAYPEKYIIPVLRAVCLMAVIVSIIGFIEFVTAKNFIYENFVDNLAYRAFRGKRVMSLHIHPAPLGTYLLGILPLSLALILNEKNKILKMLAAFYLTVIVICVILTGSRGAFFGLFMVLLIVIFFLAKRKQRLNILLLLLFLVAIILVNSVLSRPFGFHNAAYRLSVFGLFGYDYEKKLGKILALGPILKDHPFFGLGLGHFRIYFDHYLPNLAARVSPDSKVADCMYATIPAEIGLLGFGSFLMLIFSFLRRVWIKLKVPQGSDNSRYLICFSAGLGGIMTTFLTYDPLYWAAPSCLFWSYLGIISALSKPDKRTEGHG